MSLTTIQGVIENGQIRLVENVRLPENATVYVVFPESDNQPVREVYLKSPRPLRMPTPRVTSAEQAARLKKTMVGIEEDDKL